MKILFIPSWYPKRNGNNSVSGTFVREHALAASIYDEIAVLVFRHTGKGIPAVRIDQYEDSGVKIFEAWITDSLIPKANRPFLQFNRWLAFRKVIKLWGKPDLLHAQDQSSFYVHWLSSMSRIPYVISQHWSGFLRKALTKSEISLFRKSMLKAKIVLSAYYKAENNYHYYDINANVTWLPNAFDPGIFYPDLNDTKDNSILHASGFTKEKRLPDIIEAFAILLKKYPGVILHLAGDGPNRNEVMRSVQEKLPESSYFYHDHLSKYELANLMRKCRGFIFPSEFETFGCVLMEAMACGCPVLTTQIGGIPFVVSKGQGLFVQVGDINAIAEGMQQMINGSHGLDMLEIASQANQRFSRSTVGKLLHEIYMKVKDSS